MYDKSLVSLSPGPAPGHVSVCVGDRVAWRRLFRGVVPGRRADRCHAVDLLWVAADTPTAGVRPAKRWAKPQCRLLTAGRADPVLA